jgi:hypothetical protein
MDSLSIIIIVIIILLVIYLVFRFYQNKKILESFSTQNSLSTYFQPTVDSDDYMSYTNTFNSMNKPIVQSNIVSNPGWNGTWKNEANYIWAQFIQQNDKLIIALSNYSFNDLYRSNSIYNGGNAVNPAVVAEESASIFLGIGLLNSNRTIFNLSIVIENNYVNSTLGLGPNTEPSFSGIINGNVITLYANSGNGQIMLNLVEKYSDSNNPSIYPFINLYTQMIAPFILSNPDAPDTEYNLDEGSLCPANTTPFLSNDQGLVSTQYQGQPVNSCQNPDGTINCYLNLPNDSPLSPSCPVNNDGGQISRFINYVGSAYLQSLDPSNNLSICNILNYFNASSSPNFNAAVICYVSNIGNVQSLNYQFFGSLPEESTLTVQYDVLNTILNSSVSEDDNVNLLPYYRSIIQNFNANSDISEDINNAISMTNCIENNNVANSPNTMVSNCVATCQNYVNNYVPSTGNNTLLPTIWNINYDRSNTLTNDCPFILSTSQNYNTPIKYVEYNNNGTTNLSLYPDGTKQHLFMENANIINNNSNILIISTNLRANNGLYLLPSSSYGGFSQNSNIVTLSSSPEPNGKWLVIGFPLNNINNFINVLKANINF